MFRRSFPLIVCALASGACSKPEAPDCEGKPQLLAGSYVARTEAELEALRCVQVVSGDLTIAGSHASLEPLSSLVQVLGDLTISVVGNLPSLDGLDALTSIDGSLEISSNDGLGSLRGLGQLREVGGLTVRGNAALVDLSGLATLRLVDGPFVVENNQKLTSLALGEEGLEATLNGAIHVIQNPALAEVALTGLGPFAAGPERGWDIVVASNASLERLAFDVDVSRHRRIEVFDNPRLASIANSNLLTSRLDALWLTDLPALETVELGTLHFGELVVTRTGLKDLSGFGELRVDCELAVLQNPALAALPAETAGSFATSFDVQDNPSLPSCEVAALAAGLVEPKVACPDPLTGLVAASKRRVTNSGNDDAAVCE